MSSEMIQEDRIHSAAQVNSEWDSRESEEDGGDLTTSSPTPGEFVQPRERRRKVLSSSAWRPCMVGVVRTKRCSHHSCRYWDAALLCHEGSEVGWERDSIGKKGQQGKEATCFPT